MTEAEIRADERAKIVEYLMKSSEVFRKMKLEMFQNAASAFMSAADVIKSGKYE